MNTSYDNANGDSCGGGECTERRRYLLTDYQHASVYALKACPIGFHFASIYEIAAFSDMEYDSLLGFNTFPDMGGGPPVTSGTFVGGELSKGWVRRGGWEEVLERHSFANCDGWTSNGAEDFGIWLTFEQSDSTQITASHTEFLLTEAIRCDRPRQVWCIED